MEAIELLERYAREKDQDAFAAVVHHHGDWVYSSARRQLGDEHLAEDVTQAVFLLLSQKAEAVARCGNLGGWMFNTLRYCAKHVRLQGLRRERREREAAKMRPEITEREARWDEIEAQITKTTRMGYLFRIDHRLPTVEDMTANRIGSPRKDAVSEAGEYGYDAKSGQEYLLRVSRPDEPGFRNESEVSGMPGRWTTLRSEGPGSTSRWARVTKEIPSELQRDYRIGYRLFGTSSLPEVIRTAQDIEISKDTLDGDECYCVAMIARPMVPMMVNGQGALATAYELHRVWLSISHGLMPIRSEEYSIQLGAPTPPSPDQWTVATMVKPERLHAVTLQLGLRKMSNDAWLPSRSVSYSLGGNRRGSQTTYDSVMVNQDVTVKTVTIPAGAWKDVMKDMLRK